MVARTLRLLFGIMPILLLITPAFAQPSFFYYADGEQIALEINPNVIAVQFARPQAIPQAQTRFGELVDNAPVYMPAGFAGDNFALLPTTRVSEGAVVALAQSVETTRDLSVEWSNPVFRLGEFTLVVTDEFIAGFPPGTPSEAVDAYNTRNGVSIVSLLSPDVYVLRVNVSAGVDALAMANRYQEEGVALYGEPNFYTLFSRSNEPQPQPITETSERFAVANDSFFGQQWHLQNSGQYSGASAGADIRAVTAWDVSTGSSNTIIAVLDDGVQINHPDLASKIVFPYDAVTGDFDPSPTDTAVTRDQDGHGTAVAGLAAAITNNNFGVAGVCPQCRIMPIRIFRTVETSPGVFQLLGTSAMTTNAINWAVNNGAAVLSNSWTQTPSTSVTNAFRNAALNGRGGLGSVVLVAVGNSYQSPVAYPASLASVLPGMIGVSASNWCNQPKAPNDGSCSGEGWGANWGSEVVIAAPGHSLATTDMTGSDGYINGDFVYFNGTSGATPVAAGVVGLLISHNPSWTADQVRERVMRSASTSFTAGYDIATGWGVIEANSAIRNITTTTGVPNDTPGAATNITTLSYTSSQTVLGAFVTRDEPSLCELSSNTVWFRYTPTYNQVVRANTQGSNYDTVLGVYTGSPGSFTSVACNDDTGGQTSAIEFNATAGTTYSFAVGSFAGNTVDPGGVGANNASLTFNVSTPTAPPNIQINGTVQLAGRPTAPNARWSIPLTLVIAPAGGNAVITTTVTTDTSGAFSYSATSLAPGSYDIWIKNDRSLALLQTVTLANGANTLTFGLLREGDANNDNVVSLTDFSVLAATFNRAQGDTGYDSRADFNLDTVVALTDFSLLASNFNTVGATRPPS
jgi:thermitase